jgi:hypothetical protein
MKSVTFFSTSIRPRRSLRVHHPVHRGPSQGRKTDKEQMEPPYALRGRVQAGFRTAGSVHSAKGRDQCMCCSVHAVAGAGYKGSTTFGERVMCRATSGVMTVREGRPPIPFCGDVVLPRSEGLGLLGEERAQRTSNSRRGSLKARLSVNERRSRVDPVGHDISHRVDPPARGPSLPGRPTSGNGSYAKADCKSWVLCLKPTRSAVREDRIDPPARGSVAQTTSGNWREKAPPKPG